MACNRDSGCLKLYSRTYPELSSSINSSITSVNNEISDITSQLDSLEIPDDYLGKKVKDRVSKISYLLNSNVSSLNSEKTKIDGFISQKISEHKEHYEKWRRIKEEIEQAKKRLVEK